MDEVERKAREAYAAAQAVEAPNLRDYFPNGDAYDAAIAAWHANIDAARAALEEAVKARMGKVRNGS